MRSTLRSLKARLVGIRLPFSSRRLLLIALFALVGLMGVTLLYASRVLEALTTETLAYSARSLALADDVRSLQNLTVSMERSGRQYLILGDARLLRDFNQAQADGSRVARALGMALSPQEQLLTARWISLADSAADLLSKRSGASDTQKRRLFALFRDLGEVNQQIERSSRQAIARGAEKFEREMARYRQTLLAVGAWVAAVSVLAALALGLWLSWLFDELAASIANLGEHKRPARSLTGGPTDMHALALRINGVKQTLQALENDKEVFMRHISHELKTPLANLREGIALLEDRIAGQLSTEQERVVAILAANANSLHRQIEDLLQYNTAVFEAGRLDLQPLDLAALIRGVLDAQRLRCEARGIRVEITGHPRAARLDAEKMQVIFNNLLANAIHFSPDGGRIHFLIDDTDERIVVDCVDQGCGIAPDDRERIFDAFYQGSRQVPSARRGTGIGLSIVRQLVEAHHGSIGVLDSDDGAHIRIELPREPR